MAKTTGSSPRQLAVDVMRRVHRGAFAAPALSAALGSVADPRDRSLLTDLLYGTLRHEILLDACLSPRLSAPERLPEDVLTALRLGAYELLVRGTPAHAAVDEWVEVVKRQNARLSGLANAVLRRVRIPADLPADVRRSLPGWLNSEFEELLGAAAEDSALGMLQPEPLWLSDHSRNRGEAREALLADGCEVRPGPVSGSMSVRSPVPLAGLRAFREGLVQPQNPASRLPVVALGDVRDERVLDLAAGNGIKTAQLARSGARCVALEIDALKVERAQANLARLGLEARHHQADLREAQQLPPAGKVLLDAPCSGTGTLRGHPEIKLRLGREDVVELARLQQELLETAAALTLPGGTLVYSVCALTGEEGPEQARRFLAAHPEFEPLPLEALLHEDGSPSAGTNGPLPLRPLPDGLGVVVLPLGGLDGFYIARFERRD